MLAISHLIEAKNLAIIIEVGIKTERIFNLEMDNMLNSAIIIVIIKINHIAITQTVQYYYYCYYSHYYYYYFIFAYLSLFHQLNSKNLQESFLNLTPM